MMGNLAREARERGRFLQRKADLTEREARAVAWKKLGFSASGISKKTGFSEGTVKIYLERATVAYGYDTIYRPANVERDAPLEPVTEDEIMSLHERTRRWWLSAAADHPDMAPDWALDRLGIGNTEAAKNGGQR